MTPRWVPLLVLLLPLVLLAGGAWLLVRQEPPEVRLAAYATSLEGRTRNQRYNTLESLRHLDGLRLDPGATLSFNDSIGTWSQDAGYRKAPVSYNGQLVWAIGGGVCQTSTTLYNAALLAGLDVTERHRHHFAPGYVSPGRDAAVAYNTLDLKIRNPHPWPVRFAAHRQGQQVVVEVFGAAPPATSVSLVSDLHEVRAADTLRGGRPTAEAVLVHPGKPGVRVTTWRVLTGPQGVVRELLSEDDYPSMPRVVVHDR